MNSCQKEFAITVVSNDADMGMVTGGGVYKKGTTVQLVAKPASGYQFAKWDDGNTDNPRTITVKSNATYTAVFIVEGGGELTSKCEFSVSATQKVLFSPGNLQWSATNGGSSATTHAVAGGGTAAGTWRFAPNQWDTIGVENKNISSTYTGWIDLFGWATSGYESVFPYMNSTTDTDYGTTPTLVTNSDWGVYNAIYNPKTNTTDAPGTWRTLNKYEWTYLLETRSTVSGIRYAKANVHGINGLIIVPDDWSKSIYSLKNTNIANADYTSNTIYTADWEKMESAGCVFLPAVGYRSETSVCYVGSNGFYWSTSYYNSTLAYYLNFDSEFLNPSSYNSCCYGMSVRLVKNI